MKNDMHNNRGFTLMEMLIVIAIIGVLVAIAIPVLLGKMETSRESVDLANVRSAYAEVMAVAMSDDDTATHDGDVIKQADGSFKVVVSPLSQTVDGWETDITDMSIGGVASSDWVGAPKANGACTITYTPTTGKATINWGYFFEGMSLMQLSEVPNEERVAKDQETLQNLGQAILEQGWTRQELMAKLGIAGSANGTMRIADYYQLKSGSFDSEYQSTGFKISARNTDELLRILESIGYDGGDISEQGKSTGNKISNATDTTYSNSLFYSDQLATNKYGDWPIDATKRSILIENIETGSDGKITKMTIYTKAMDEQANMGDADKALFRFTVSLS